MKTENKVLMNEAREALTGRWKIAIGGCFLYSLILIVIQFLPKVGGLASLLITGPMAVGLATFSLSLSRKQDASVSQIFVGFKRYGRILAAYLLVVIFTILWFLLFIIPGIIAGLSYSQTFFILAEDKSISARDAIKKSKAMMYGNKKKLFYLHLRFFGWLLLCLLTVGIGFLWFMPYVQVAIAKFYDDISKNPAPQDIA